MTMLIIYQNAMFNCILKKVKLLIIHVDPLQTRTLLYQLKMKKMRNSLRLILLQFAVFKYKYLSNYFMIW